MLLVTPAFGASGLAHRRTVRQSSSTCDLHTFDLSLIFTASSTISRQLLVTVLPSGTTGTTLNLKSILSHTQATSVHHLSTILLDRCSLLKLLRTCCTQKQMKLVLLTNYYFLSRPSTTNTSLDSSSIHRTTRPPTPTSLVRQIQFGTVALERRLLTLFLV